MDDPSTEGDNPPALTARTVESLEGTFDFEEDESEDTIEKENTSYDSSLAATNHDQNNQNTQMRSTHQEGILLSSYMKSLHHNNIHNHEIEFQNINIYQDYKRMFLKV